MDLRQLRNFIRVVEFGGITAAAEQIGIAQPALSRQIKALEAELGVPLLRRHGRGVMATEEGLRLTQRARAILEEVEALTSDVSGSRAPLSGLVTLGLPPTVAEILATHLIERIMVRHPDVKLRIVSGFSGHVQDWLMRGKIDLGVAYEGQKSPSIRASPIVSEQLFLIRAADRGRQDSAPVPARSALSGPLILPSPEHGLRGHLEALAQEERIALEVVLEIDILPTMLEFVERGLGNTVLPLVSVLPRLRERRLVAHPIQRQDIDRTLVLMTPLNRPGSRLTNSFTEILRAEVHAMVAAGKWPGTTL